MSGNVVMLPTKRFRDMTDEEKRASWEARERDRISRVAARQAHDYQPGRIYAATLEDGVVVKVGFTINVKERLERLAWRFREPLRLLGEIPAYRMQERWLHEYWKQHRSHTRGSTETYWYDAIHDQVAEMLETKRTLIPERVYRAFKSGSYSDFPKEACA